MAFFKSGNDMIKEGNDLIKRKEFDKAIKAFQKALSKGISDKKEEAEVNVMIALVSLRSNLSNSSAYANVANMLRGLGDADIELGLYNVTAEKLAIECELLFKEFAELSRSRDPAKSNVRGEALIKVAQEYMMKMQNDILIIPEMFAGVSMNGGRRALKLLAEGNEDLAENMVFSDPRKAAEFQQIAYNYRIQMGESGEANRQKIAGYSKSATCWMCRRDVSGERVHFFPMSSDVGVMKYKDSDESHLPSKNDSGDAVYVCRACYSAISRRADSIANNYHRQAMAEIARVESSLRAEIAAVNTRVNSISYR